MAAFRPELVAVDLDGTLLRTDRTVGPRAKRAIASLQACGVDVSACTGRPPRRVRALAADLALRRAIVYQGSATYHADDDRVEVHRQMPADVVQHAIATLRAAHPGVMCALETDRGWYVDEALAASPHLGGHPGEHGPDGVGDVVDFVGTGVVKLLVRHPERGARDLAGVLADAPVYHTWTTPDLLEVLSHGVNKCVTLAEYAAATGVPQSSVAAFGDQHNDREMLAWAGLGIAMANGSDEAIAAADAVTGTNDEDGVAVVLEAWCRAATGATDDA